MNEEELRAIEVSWGNDQEADVPRLIAEVRKLQFVHRMAVDGLAQMEAAVVAVEAERQRLRAFLEAHAFDEELPGAPGAEDRCLGCQSHRREPHDSDCELVALLVREPKP